MIRVGFHVEGQVDLAVLGILVERLTGDAVEPVSRLRRMRGVTRVQATVAAACWDFWYHDAAGAVLHLDRDDSPAHEAGHDPSAAVSECRHCQLVAAVPRLPSRPSGELRVAIAVPCQAIEAWLVAADPALARWHGQAESLDRRHAKRIVYRVEDLARLTGERMCRAAVPLAREGDLAAMRGTCPSLDSFAREVEAWFARQTPG